jgi:prophage antirepressor-like protein
MSMQLTLQVFEYEGGQQVRTTEIDGQIWFYAVDVCQVLEIKNVPDAVSSLDDDEKMTIANTDSQKGSGAQKFLVISEPGLYSLILRSRKPEAKAFKRWITHDVLPSIRKAGGYILPGMRTVPKFVRRFNENWDRVSSGHFSVISELFIRVYGRLEQVGYTLPDKGTNGREIRPDVSVGKLFPKWLESKYPQLKEQFSYYKHKLPDGTEIDARQYKIEVLPAFIEYIETAWVPDRAYSYFEERDKAALSYLPKMLPDLQVGDVPLIDAPQISQKKKA